MPDRDLRRDGFLERHTGVCSIGQVIGAAGNIGGALIGASATKSAANAQLQAAQLAAQTELGMYAQTRSDLTPYMSMGQGALSQLGNLFGINPIQPTQVLDPATGKIITTGGSGSGGSGGGQGVPNTAAMFQALSNFPGYQFGLQQGIQGLDRSAASRGMLLSGAQLKAAQEFGNNYAMQQAWNPYITQLNQFAGLGENAAAGVGNVGANAAGGAAADQLSGGAAKASGIVGSANQWTDLLARLGTGSSSYGGGNFGGLSHTPISLGSFGDFSSLTPGPTLPSLSTTLPDISYG